jgi:hypothetical protein
MCAVALLCCGSGNEYFCLPSFIAHTVIYLDWLGEFYSLDSVLLLKTGSKKKIIFEKSINH